jgi:hypothetical protein
MTETQRRNLSKAPAKPALGRGRIRRQIARSFLVGDIRSSADILDWVYPTPWATNAPPRPAAALSDPAGGRKRLHPR